MSGLHRRRSQAFPAEWVVASPRSTPLKRSRGSRAGRSISPPTPTRSEQECIDDFAGEFPRFDQRFAGLDYRHGFFAASSDRSDCFDTLAHINTRATYRLPRGDAVSEPIFVPREGI